MARTGNLIFGLLTFFVLCGSAGLLIASLFTHSWLEEKFETGKQLFAYHLNHGLYEICTKKFVLGKQIQGSGVLDKVKSVIGTAVSDNSPASSTDQDFKCITRFDRKCAVETKCDVIDNMLRNYHENLVYWEIVSLSLMCVSCALNLLILLLFALLCLRCPSVLAFFTLAAAGCSLAVLVTFSLYHQTTYSARDNVFFKMVVSESNRYGYSFWMAAGGCALQFLGFVLLLLQEISLCCWRGPANGA